MPLYQIVSNAISISIITASHLDIRYPAAPIGLDDHGTRGRSSGTHGAISGPIGAVEPGAVSGLVVCGCSVHSGPATDDGEVVGARVVACPAHVGLGVLAKLHDEVPCVGHGLGPGHIESLCLLLFPNKSVFQCIPYRKPNTTSC